MNQTLVIGGTGAMGSTVVRHLLQASDGAVSVLTRNPQSEQAVELTTHGGGRVRMVQGDVNDPGSLSKAMADVARVFCNTDFFSTRSAVGEYRQGLAALEAARGADVEKFVWSSLDSAVTLTHGRLPVPHYDGKAAVAAHINLQRSEEMMQQEVDGWYSEHVSVLTTAPYMENFQLRLAPQPGRLPDGRDGLTFVLPLGDGRYPLISLEDIAWFAVHMFENWQAWGARDLSIVADSLTGEEIAAAFERVTGTPTAYAPLPLEVLRASVPDVGHDFAAMFQLFQERDVLGQDRDTELLHKIHPGLLTFEDWLRTTGWDGTEQQVQKFPVRLPEH
ncbi:NmrA/HSCARG family protein [Jatrophihabitans lederbergiae]|uniref:NmrA/HSCARG family protein n=1 Tax=Jatrophihabitans lederbergiae TaxID=3075547 RepID=A0ABU2JEV9_9ACTN|nr:NmrA/HSCARG family protein [Jatrophihabitans sp. DSM 44399]MDT0263520.1 NmrA/HSCARG family protein [Jatrophihabitans sp. DSM 44399]